MPFRMVEEYLTGQGHRVDRYCQTVKSLFCSVVKLLNSIMTVKLSCDPGLGCDYSAYGLEKVIALSPGSPKHRGGPGIFRVTFRVERT